MTNNEKLSDEQLVELVRTQDQELYTQIVKRYQEKLLRYSAYLVRDENLAEDIVQTAFIKAFQNLNGFDVSKKFSSWIYRIVHNQAINTIKKNKKLVNLEPSHWDQISSETNIEEEFDKKQLSIMVKKSIDKLDIKYRSPMSLFYLQDKSYEDISDIVRIPVGTVGTRINRGKKILKSIMIKEGEYEKN